MMLRTFAFVAAAVAGSLAVQSVAAASAKKNSLTTPRTSSGKQGTLVAMSGSASVGSSSSGADASYVALGLFPFQYVGQKTTIGNTTNETPVTSLSTMPKMMEFYAGFGHWNVRPEFSLEQNTPSSLTLTYDVAPSLEIGGVVSFTRTSAKGVNKVEDTASDLVIGPRAYYAAQAGGFPLEVDAALGLISRLSESKNDATTTKTRDVSGYVFALNVKTTRELSSSCEGFAQVGLGYSSETDKTNKDAERTQSGLSLSIVPAGLRFKF